MKTTGDKPHHKQDQVEKAYMGLRNLLFHNDIAPGQKLSYRDLSERLGMSQTPVIQALKRLEFQQLVRHEPNRGYHTAPVSLKEVGEIYDLRELIEIALLPVMIDNAGRPELKRLEAALSKHHEAAKAPMLYERLQKDLEFHLLLSELSGCGVQHQTLKNLFDLLYLKYGANILFSTFLNSADDDHRALFECISRKDSPRAVKILSSHIRRVKMHVLNGLEERAQAKEAVKI